MRKPFIFQPLLLGLAVAGIAQPARAEVLGFDPVSIGESPPGGEYAVGPLAGQDPILAGFSGAWADSGASATATGLAYTAPNYFAAGGGALEHTAAGRPFRAMDAPLADAFAAEGTVYWSFLAKFGTFTDNQTWNGYAAVEVGANGSNDSGKTLAIGVQDGTVENPVVPGEFLYQINNGTKASLGVASDTETHLFVVRFDLSAEAASDSVTIWIDPDLSGGLGSDPPDGLVVGGLDLFIIDNFRFGAGGANNFVDEVRFGTTLGSVIEDDGPELPPVPVFVSHPDDQIGFVGDNLILSGSAPANPEPGYQWEYSEDGSDPWEEIEGATSAVFEIPAAPYTANGFYRVVATNTNGSATSDDALVDLIFPDPTITRQPASVFAAEGSTVELSVEATGIGELSYEWYKNFEKLDGEVSSTLTLENIDSGDLAEYFVDVFDDAAEEIGELPTVSMSDVVEVGFIDSPMLGYEPVLIGTDLLNGEYTEGAANGQDPDVGGFTGAWSGDNSVSASATGLAYLNYEQSGGAFEHTSAGRPYRSLDGLVTSVFAGEGAVYWSFLAKFGTAEDNSAWNGYAAVEVGSDAANDTGKALAIGVQNSTVPGEFMYQINNGDKMSLGTPSDIGTHLFLVRFDLSATAASDAVTIWIDPDLSAGLDSDPAGGTAVPGLDLLPIGNFRFGAGGANNFADEVRFGTTLESVIPAQLPSQTYESWIALYPGTGELDGFEDDPDGDGLANGIESYLGTDPTSGNPGLVEVTATDEMLIFQHSQSSNPPSNVAAVYEWSLDLGEWFDNGATSDGTTVAFVTNSGTPTAGTTTVTATASGTPRAKLFVRLRVSSAP